MSKLNLLLSKFCECGFRMFRLVGNGSVASIVTKTLFLLLMFLLNEDL